MFYEQREVLDEIVKKLRAGRVTRRTFLEKAMTVGLTTSAAFSLLEACNEDKEKITFSLTWESEHQNGNIYNKLVDDFNKSNNYDIHVMYIIGPVDTGPQHDEIVKMLKAGQGSIDVMSMDVIWPAEFAGNHWTLPIESRWSESERAKYLPGPIEACTFNGSIWAVPLLTDAGLIYYRKDLVSKAATTWDEMTELAAQTQSDNRYGYVWQGAQYEGLVCNFVEVLYGYGGAVLDANNPQKVVVNSPEAYQALNQMVNWVGSISPQIVTTFKEEEARLLWENDRAVFMRNWPYAYALGNDTKTSKIAGKFEVLPMLATQANPIGHSCIGGWQLGINAFSKHPDAAWKFIEYMISPSVQKRIAIESSLAVTLTSIYDDF